jgi:hypothetical protein
MSIRLPRWSGWKNLDHGSLSDKKDARVRSVEGRDCRAKGRSDWQTNPWQKLK